jgi:hypothetical protein
VKVGEPVDYLYEPRDAGPIYDHPMDEILGEIEARKVRPRINIELPHAFLCLAIITLYLGTL